MHPTENGDLADAGKRITAAGKRKRRLLAAATVKGQGSTVNGFIGRIL